MIARLLLIGAVCLLSACSSKETLVRDLTERDAIEIAAVLYDGAISSDKVFDTKAKSYSITVNSGESQRAMAVLRAVGLPRPPRPQITDLFKSSGFAPTPFEERIRFIYGTAQELERTISLMNGVLQARAHIVIPDGGKKGAPIEAKASIFIDYDDRYSLELQVPKIRRLVAESVDGLAPERVEILLTPTKLDMKRIGSVPMINVLGIRVHQDDYYALIGVLLACLTVAGSAMAWATRSQWRKRR